MKKKKNEYEKLYETMRACIKFIYNNGEEARHVQCRCSSSNAVALHQKHPEHPPCLRCLHYNGHPPIKIFPRG